MGHVKHDPSVLDVQADRTPQRAVPEPHVGNDDGEEGMGGGGRQQSAIF